MKLRTDTIGNFENPIEDNIFDAVLHLTYNIRHFDTFYPMFLVFKVINYFHVKIAT